jgi:hypothetical protein
MRFQIRRKPILFTAAGLLLLLTAQPGLSAPPQPPPTPAKPVKAPPLTSYLPVGPLEQFVIAQFDIRTINSSVNQGREFYQARLMELGYRPEARRRPSDPLLLQSDEGTITLSLFERGDHNLDGIEDVLVCMTDRTKDGRFTATQPLVLQKYSEATPLIALAVGVIDPRCPRSG